MEIRKALIPISEGKRSGRKITASTLTIHSTDNPNSSAQNERDWLVNPDNHRAASWHVCVDQREAVMAIPLDERALHAGGKQGNDTSLSLEICESGDREQTLRNAVNVTAGLLQDRDWGVDKLRQHHDWSGKNCPRILRDTGRWDWFVGEVEKALKGEDEMTIYKTYEDCPEWAKPTVSKLVRLGLLKGDENQHLDLEHNMLRGLVINDRAGLYK